MGSTTRERLEEAARRSERLLDALGHAGRDGAWRIGCAKLELETALAALRDQPCPSCGAPNRVTLEEWGRGEGCGRCAEDGP
jgi:hypothetical protein